MQDKGSLNATFITIYDNIVKRVEDGEDLDVAAKDEVKASRFKISSIWAEVLREVGQGDKGLECQDEEALAKSQAQDFAQALTDALILANSDLSEEVLMEAKETVAAGMEEDFEEAVAAACGISGFSIGPKFKFALRLVEPVTEGYVVALGGGKSDGVRSTPRRIPSDEVSSTSTSTTGSGSASASTSTSGSGSASASSSASASGSGSTSASTSMSSSTDSASRMTPTVNGADGRCRRQFIVCCLKRKILSGECDCIAGRDRGSARTSGCSKKLPSLSCLSWIARTHVMFRNSI
ncbi:unnamed protein product [Ostreobium quekettii]|uniref:Uncharacterized protein n=1 Tax=Ostreobium quekettii TaxID=121088 RepID=A0A8S1IQE0_9CHLO|nr:unnamed protein product [Ostreobium quekettii]|eukprot:evm.model.scf_356.2 EVM.evm.TU.scf_356.2   scf_356:28072-31350(-)